MHVDVSACIQSGNSRQDRKTNEQVVNEGLVVVCFGAFSPVIRPLASIGGCQLIRMARGRPSRLITVKSLGAELGAVNCEQVGKRGWGVGGSISTGRKR